MRSVAHQFPRYRRVCCVENSILPLPKKQSKTKQNRQSVSLRCGPKNSARATKAGIFIIKKCGWKKLEKNKNATPASRSKIPAESLQDAEREDGAEYYEESWQRLRGRTIMSGETLVEKLHEAVCCRACHPDVSFLENVNCKSCVSSNKEVYLLPNCLHL